MALGIFAGLAVGLACGLVNELLIAKLKLPDFIVTLGTLSVYRGAALIYTNGQPIYGLPDGFRAVFAGEVLGVPTPVILAIVVAGLAFFLVRFAALGEQIVAVGGNEEAARLSGINIDRVKIIVYTLSGLLSSLAGFVLIARIGAAEPIGGNGFRTAGDRRGCDRRGKSLRRCRQPARIADRGADAGRFAEWPDADERSVLLAICGLWRRRDPCRLRRPVGAAAAMSGQPSGGARSSTPTITFRIFTRTTTPGYVTKAARHNWRAT